MNKENQEILDQIRILHEEIKTLREELARTNQNLTGQMKP